MNFSKYLMDDFQRDVNKTMAQVCRIGALLMIFVIGLNASGVFTLDGRAYPPLVACVIVMLIPTLYYDVLRLDSPGMRYVFLTMTVMMSGILYTMFSYHVVIMLIFPTVMSVLYCEKRDVVYTEMISVPVRSIIWIFFSNVMKEKSSLYQRIRNFSRFPIPSIFSRSALSSVLSK